MARRALFTATVATLFGLAPAVAHAEEVVVRGSQALAFSEKLDSRANGRLITDLASLLEPALGVHVRRMGADDSFATASIRGSSSNQVAFILGGVPMSAGGDPTLDLGSLPLFPGSTARVYRTFTPGAVGQGSLGGTIVIESLRPDLPAASELWSAVGSFGTLRLRASDVRPLGSGRIATGLSASRADGAFEYLDPVHSTPTTDAWRTRENNGHASVDGLVAWSHPAPFSDGRVGALMLAQGRKQGLAGPVQLPTPFAHLETSRLLGSVELGGNSSAGAWNFVAYGKREHLLARNTETAARASQTMAESGHNLTIGGLLGTLRPRIGILAMQLRGETSLEKFSPDRFVGVAPPPSARRATSSFGMDALLRPSDVIAVGLSGRASFILDSDRAPLILATAHIGAEYSHKSLRAAAHFGRVGRAPSFVERYGNGGAVLGDENLSAETAWAADAGVSWADRLGPIALRAEATIFGTWATDLITYTLVGAYGKARMGNIARARIVGVEAMAEMRHRHLEARLAYSGLSTRDLSSCMVGSGTCTRPELPGRPAHDVTFDVTGLLGPVRLRYGLDALIGMVADRTGSIEVPARVLHNLGVQISVHKHIRFGLDARNILDSRTMTYDGALGSVRRPLADALDYPLPGRSFLATMTVQQTR